ncbi:MAG: alpha-L-fucosidase [Porphyromonadaceae bacterium]|nr:MAG: alpha-L-fucosidase [Porphyromonadaceae bacterium]
MKKCLFFILFGFLIGGTVIAQTQKKTKFPVPERGFISSTPAETWEQGLISGNGTIGANVMSRPLNETVIFTHERMFLPQGPPVMPPNQSARLFEIRSLIDRGLYKQATNLQFDLSGQTDFMYPDPFVPAFDLNIGMDTGKEIKDYVRSVDFQTGETTVHWSDSRGVYERRLFVSRADSIAVMLITGPGKGSVNCRMALRPRQVDAKLGAKTVANSNEVFNEHVSKILTTAEKSFLTYKCSFTKAYPGSIHALEGIAYIAAKGGTSVPQGDTLMIAGADQVLVFIDIRILYDPDKSQIEASKKHLSALEVDYQKLLKRHALIHGKLFNRVRLDIGGGKDHQLTTEELLIKSTNKELNNALIEKEFDAGRYNIISCTGQLPPNLQGVWGGTYVPGWASDYTHNGNVPSAIASMLMGNYPELVLAYTSYIESIVPWLEINAKHMFGVRGIVLPSRSTTNGFNNALAPDFAGGFWVAGASWAAHFFYDYYLYTGDQKFLAEHALLFMEKAGLFFEDYLYTGPDGKFVFSPTQSPENTPGNTNSQGTFNATMDVAAAKELMNNLIQASNVLGVNREKIPVWKAMLKKMPDYLISEEGVVKEWLTPKLKDQLNHRHSSQLYALFDGMPDEIAQNPELRAGFKHLIELKLQRHWSGNSSGFMSFGLVQLGQASTSLGEADLAYQCLVPLVNRYWLNNLASMHNSKSLFNMDISGGMPAVIIKMLVASDPDRIQLLPALPSVWPTGEIKGVLCRGQIEITSLKWNKNAINVRMISGKDQTINLEAPSGSQKVTLVAGKEITLELKY